MTSDFMKELLSKDEKITVEYKNCQYGIQEDVYETVCSFSNRYGGYIIMGVEDDGTPIGINRNMSKDMRKNFVNQLNNPDRMSPTLYLSIEEFEYEGKLLLWVYVPPTSTVEKCINRIYDRNEDGDMDITDSPIQLQNMYNRKSNTYAEHKIFPYVTKDDLRIDLMDKVRNLAKSKNPDHQWLKMSDDEIKEALTNACAIDFVNELENGLDTMIGEKGVGISEGQAQRIAIARAFLRVRPILILDEATSSLDPETEVKVLKSVKSLSSNPTCIIITHRPSALNICNRIMKLEKGHIREVSRKSILEVANELV